MPTSMRRHPARNAPRRTSHEPRLTPVATPSRIYCRIAQSPRPLRPLRCRSRRWIRPTKKVEAPIGVYTLPRSRDSTPSCRQCEVRSGCRKAVAGSGGGRHAKVARRRVLEIDAEHHERRRGRALAADDQQAQGRASSSQDAKRVFVPIESERIARSCSSSENRAARDMTGTRRSAGVRRRARSGDFNKRGTGRVIAAGLSIGLLRAKRRRSAPGY